MYGLSVFGNVLWRYSKQTNVACGMKIVSASDIKSVELSFQNLGSLIALLNVGTDYCYNLWLIIIGFNYPTKEIRNCESLLWMIKHKFVNNASCATNMHLSYNNVICRKVFSTKLKRHFLYRHCGALWNSITLFFFCSCTISCKIFGLFTQKWSALQVKHFKKVKDHFGSTEITAVSQADAINFTGLYEIGNIHGYTEGFKVYIDAYSVVGYWKCIK